MQIPVRFRNKTISEENYEQDPPWIFGGNTGPAVSPYTHEYTSYTNTPITVSIDVVLGIKLGWVKREQPQKDQEDTETREQEEKDDREKEE